MILRSRSLLPTLASAALIAATLIPCANAQTPADNTSLGILTPSAVYEPTMIAIPSFGSDGAAPVGWETMPRIIRRDLELTGFFTMPPDQNLVVRLNLADVKNRSVNYPEWEKMGAKHLLMANVSSPAPGKVRAMVLLHDIESREMIMNRYIEGPSDDIRKLAHKISDEVVMMTKATQGFAQTQLIFINEQVPGVKEVAIMDADGFNTRPLTRYSSICTTPTWGANGTEFYYTSYAGNRAVIYGQMLSSGKTWPIAGHGGTNHSPAWSDTNRRIAMVLSKDGGSELYSANRDGGDLRRLTETKAIEASPEWSADGTKLAFTSNEAGGVNIFIANADGSGRRKLTNRGSWNDAPSWSHDNTRIAFVSKIEGRHDIFVINSDGDPASVRRLTMGQGNNESPSWAPNGRHIAFASDRSGQWQIYIMLDDGSSQKVLTTSGRNTQPSWGPLPE